MFSHWQVSPTKVIPVLGLVPTVNHGRKEAQREEDCTIEARRSHRRYGAEVTHAILTGKARTTFNKRVPVPETDTGA
ncbi:hypothetical protein F2Q70_00044124 [Brassica cretica]|uniref:Uncharacterized protein n=1 Tax=Brassica cretica TaxID=69181 RepID=A0A8S9KMR1_BRACR|nr:hypothetical protein F2Q70_00044124 [Brassica cretica]